jgi:hypothetical protein
MTNAAVIESMLLRWGEGPSGKTVTFLLPEDDGPHPFKGLKCGPSNGQRLALSVALISDDETQKELEPPKSYAQRAGILCGNEAFHTFLTEQYPTLAFRASASSPNDAREAAAIVVRGLCGVQSRGEIKDGTTAGRRYLELDAEFAGWLRHG